MRGSEYRLHNDDDTIVARDREEARDARNADPEAWYDDRPTLAEVAEDDWLDALEARRG